MTVYNMFKDSEIVISEIEKKITIKRGVWNFSYLELDLTEEENANYIYKIFYEIQEKRVLDLKSIDKKYKDTFNQLISGKFFYPLKKNQSSSNILIITDEIEWTQKVVNNINLSPNVVMKTVNEITEKLIRNHDFKALRQNPIICDEIEANWSNYLTENNIELISIINCKINNDFCKIINHIEQRREIVYLLMDKDFSYLFGTKKIYTGCYECFYKRILAKMKFTNRYIDNYYSNKLVLNDTDKLIFNILLSQLLQNFVDFF